MQKQTWSTNVNELPDSYVEKGFIDLKNDKRINLYIQFIFILIAGLMVGLAIMFQFPIKNDLETFQKIILTIGLVVIYMIIHELTHGMFIKIFSKKNPKYCFRFPYLATGSKSYFNKKCFIVITLAPVVIWGLISIILINILPNQYFLSMYVVIGLNFAGAAGDYIQVYAFLKLPSQALLQDDGKQTRVYLPSSL